MAVEDVMADMEVPAMVTPTGTKTIPEPLRVVHMELKATHHLIPMGMITSRSRK